MVTKSEFLKGYLPNFETLKLANRNGDLALVHCKDKAIGKDVAVLAAISFDGEEYSIAPLAKMFDGDPYQELIDPFTAMEMDHAAD